MAEMTFPDVSEHNGDLTPAWFQQYPFSIIRTHSGFREDRKVQQNIQAVRAAGLPYAAYVYLVPQRDPAWQAREMVRLAPGARFYAIDAEEPGLSPDMVITALRALPRDAWLYSYVPFLTGALRSDVRLSAYPLWIAGYGPNNGSRNPLRPAPPWPHRIHQFTSHGGLDLNVADTGILTGGGASPTPPPAAVPTPTTHEVSMILASDGKKFFILAPNYVKEIDGGQYLRLAGIGVPHYDDPNPLALLSLLRDVAGTDLSKIPQT